MYDVVLPYSLYFKVDESTAKHNVWPTPAGNLPKEYRSERKMTQ